ncbi:hypothetical protein [Arvimicrobium flavum]|uniref:hypothetical protein n=1 Tax=Arvimicrobium flavum TaxID=3393320 RepID=UPI00237A9334|nr:hypothetical protein [Mesorhizobium shangrilense]
MPRKKTTDAAADKKPTTAPAPKTKKQPALLAYYVPDREKPYWTKIGAAFSHEDGKGMTLDLELLPASGGRIVLREPKAETDNDK